MFDLEWGDVYEFAPVLMLIGVMVVSPRLPPEIQPIVTPLGMIAPIVFMVVLSEALKWQAAEYNHILAICRPSNVQLDLYYNVIESREVRPNFYTTKLTLEQKVKHPYWQVMEYLVIKHWNTWEDRIEFTKRKVKFKGEWVTHSKSAVITLYEEGASDVDHLKPIPTFWMTEAPRDFYDPQDYYREVVAPLQTTNGGRTLQTLSQTQDFDVKSLRKQLADEKAKNIEFERQALTWHGLAIKQEQEIQHLKNELHAVLNSKTDMLQGVVEMLLMWLSAHADIREALKAARGPYSWLKSKYVVLALIAVMLIVFVLNPDPIMKWLTMKEIQALIIILALIGGAAYYYRRR